MGKWWKSVWERRIYLINADATDITDLASGVRSVLEQAQGAQCTDGYVTVTAVRWLSEAGIKKFPYMETIQVKLQEVESADLDNIKTQVENTLTEMKNNHVTMAYVRVSIIA